MSQTADSLLLKAHCMVDATGAAPKKDVAVVIEHGIIKEIEHQAQVIPPPGCKLLDLGEMTIMPGIVDAHMHFFGVPSDQLQQLVTEAEPYRALRAAGEARKMLEAGVTSARCLGSSIGPYLKRAINEGHIPGPQILAAGEFICSTGGTWDNISFPIEWVKAKGMLADGVAGVRDAVRSRIRQGANVIKVGLSKGKVDDKEHAWGDDPYEQIASYGLAEIRALVEEAHINRLKVSAHCIGDESVRNAVIGGIDVIEHGYGITEETRRMLVDQNKIVVSTISQLFFHKLAEEPYHYPQWRRDVYQRHIEVMRIDFEKSLKAGVRYALGTDLIGYPTHPQDMAAKEFEMAVEWGMDPLQAIMAGTQVSAEALGLADQIGTLEIGKQADIIGFYGDPLEDIKILQNVKFVMQNGKTIIYIPQS